MSADADSRRTAHRQITELIEVLSTDGGEVLGRSCRGRQKLGDGMVATCTQHSADTYKRIAAFARGHPNARHTSAHDHDTRYSAENVSLSGIKATRCRR